MANLAMGPPLLPSYSLRVQLYASNAHSSSDKPIRCFRVVASPEITIQEFCQEASRIHEINYGEPLTIKKVQDDQEFDVTQSEILGNLFPTTAIIRIIQASSIPGIRDSVPPTSALRFDPANINRKREREGSPRPNKPSPSSAYKPNKRQRVSDLDPDQPVPSCERDLGIGRPALGNGRKPDTRVIPDSQRSTGLNTTRHVRARIPETPSPPPPPEAQRSIQNNNGSSIHQGRKSLSPTLPEHTHLLSQANNSSPLRQSSERAQLNVANSSRSKNASYHIQRATERGTSVSTAATSPLSGDQQLPKQNGVRSASKRKPSDPILPPLKVNGKRNSRSPNEDSVYENIESDGEGSAILRSKILKLKNSPNSGLPGMVWAKAKKLNTPSNSTRRTSRSRERREQLPPAGELPLTPASKEREESKQLQQAEEARNARIAAAGAAKHRRQEEEEEETRLTEVERAKREGQERLEVEEFKKEEARRQVVFAKAARLEKEKEWKLKEERKTEEKRKGEQIAKEKEEANRQEQEQAECLRKVDEEKQQAKKAAEEEDKNSKKKASSESVNQERNSSPAGPQGTPVSTRGPQSSTPFMPVPSAKKSAMKSSVFSSQAAASSSLAITKTSPSPSKSVGIEAQLTLPKGRRVSFNDQIESTETPSKTQTSKTSTPKLSAIKLSGKRESLVKVVPPEKQSCTPILPPSTIKRPSKERSATLNTASIVQTAIVAPRLGFIANPSFKKTSPQVVIKSMSPTTRITPSQKSKTPVESKTAKEKAKSKSKSKSTSSPVVQPTTVDISPDESESEDGSGDDEDEDKYVPEERKPSPVKSASKASLAQKSPPNQKPGPDREVSTADKESVEKTSKNSSPTRDSRSPVVFTQHTQPAEPEPPASPESDSASEDVDDEEEEESAGGDDTKPQNQDEESGYEDSGSEEDEVDDDEGAEVQVPKSSLPELLLSKTKTTAITATIPASSKQDSSQSKKMQHPATDSDEEGSTQDEVDQQLTSSLYTVPARAVSNTSVLAPRGSTTIPVPTSSAPRPQFRFGASLSSLNEKKPVFGAARKQGIVVKGAAPKKLELDEDEESEEEEEESDDESSESSDDEEDAKPIDSIVYSNPGPEPKPNDSTTSSGSSSITNSDSGEDDDSTSGKDSEAGIERAKNELAAEIECFAKESQGTTDEIPKPKRVRLKSPQEAKKMDPKAKRSDDRYLWGYQFQQPA